ncbi:hypothetical protein HOH11_00720 [Candidatus Woesearchaeota archaeon]|jgi:hypothetical protein|nr:hypothetical protein [Candidatus Woesearchaeota archaeon]MBT6023115.1 hypothetical protein [Candidatus Woesearchaeota archaeon]
MAKKNNTMNYWYSIYGLLLIAVGWMSFRGGWSIEEAFGGLLMLWGLKKLFMGRNC